MRKLLGMMLGLSVLMPSFCYGEEVSAWRTDRGVVRDHNEDSVKVFGEHGVYVVADGMGGHAAGEVASAMAVEAVEDYVKLPVWEKLKGVWPQAGLIFMGASFFEANRRIIIDASLNLARHGMGTTMVLLVSRKGYVDIINVGDSRAYVLHDKKLIRVSVDQSLLTEYIKAGVIKTQAEVDAFPYKNVITQALGTQPQIVPDVYTRERVEGDVYLLSSDGLFDELRDEEIERIILDHGEDYEGAGSALVEEAKKSGGHDNITVVLVKMGSSI